MPPPPVTYRVSGYVTHNGAFGLREARVEARVDSATSDVKWAAGDGGFTFDGLSGDVEFLVTKEGYHPVTQHIHVARNLSVDFNLKPFVEILGTYTLTIIAAPDCRDNLPAALQPRTYTAEVTGGGGLRVRLTGANGLSVGGFGGWVTETGVRFDLQHWENIGPLVMERLTPTTVLGIEGTVLTPSRFSLSGVLSGALYIHSFVSGNWGYEEPIAICSSNNHQFLMSP